MPFVLFVMMCWWWHTTHVNILKPTLNNNTNIVDVVFTIMVNSPTLQTHIIGKRKWNVNTSTTFPLLRMIFRKGDQSLKCGEFSFTSNQRHTLMEMITMFYHKGVYIAMKGAMIFFEKQLWKTSLEKLYVIK